MFGLFNKKDPNKCPIPEERRLWLEESFSLLVSFFGKEKVTQGKILVPHYSCFPIKYDGSIESAAQTLRIVAAQMDVAFDEIELTIYREKVNDISSGDPWGGRIYLNSAANDKSAAGLYFGKDDGKYQIAMEQSYLAQPENMVATFAHEIAHIKLLGENRIEENDEKLTDLTTVIFGLGIFNANGAFQTFQNYRSSGWQKLGYLKQMEWGYVLALYAYLREETSPKWIDYLSMNVKADFKRAEKFIINNEDIIFK
jgi:hypothetical protein